MTSDTLAQAISYREACRYQEAISWLEAWIGNNKDDVAAMSLLAQICFLIGADARANEIVAATQRLDANAFHVLRNVSRSKARSGATKEALDAAQAAYDRSPDEETCLVLSSAWSTIGNDVVALQLIEEALVRKPQYAEAFASRALIHSRRNDTAAAITDAERAVSLKPAMVPLQRMLAEFRLRGGNLPGAINSLRAAMQVAPSDANVLIQLGALLAKAGDSDEALSILEMAVERFPQRGDAWTNYGVALQGANRSEDAAQAYRKGLEITPQSADLANNLGALASAADDWVEALSWFDRAVAIQPRRYEFLINRSRAFDKLHRLDEAERDLRQAFAVAQKPAGPLPSNDGQSKTQFAEAQGLLGRFLAKRGALEEAEPLLRASFADAPHRVERLHLAELLLPKILPSPQSIDISRRRYGEGIARLRALPHKIEDSSGISTDSFYLAYHGLNDRPIMEKLHELYRAAVPTLTFAAPHVSSWPSRAKSRIRVGFCSQFFSNHTIGKLYHGHLAYMDRDRFETVLIQGHGVQQDDYTTLLANYASKVIRLPSSIQEQQQQIAAEELDVLFYTDIGMSPAQYFLAFSRLAPVQAVGWGHPDTTGIGTIDYFLSAESLEDDGSSEAYSENLVRLNRLPSCYEPIVTPTTIPSRAKMGLPLRGALYGCPQSLFKFHPDFDAILSDILSRDPNGHLVVIGSADSSWNDTLRTRWTQKFPNINERTVFLPRQPLERFMGLMAHFDVLLDPVHFGSGNTLYEAMVYGTPIVTWPGHFMRGRIVAAAYRQMGVEGAPVARDFADYARLAVELGTNEQMRHRLRGEIVNGARSNLFKDVRAVREFESFVGAAVEAARAGRKLPQDWRPDVTQA